MLSSLLAIALATPSTTLSANLPTYRSRWARPKPYRSLWAEARRSTPHAASLQGTSLRAYPRALMREGHVNVGEVTDGVTLALSALGRSNSEANPATWKSSGISTTFRQFDWSAGGWDGSSLQLVNGSSITIPATFFATDPMGLGGTIELELRTDNVLSSTGAVVSCLDDKGVGFIVTGKQAELRTASGAIVVTKFATGEFYRIAFVIQPKSGSRLLEIYVNGIRSGAVSYGQADTLLQVASKPIDMTSQPTYACVPYDSMAAHSPTMRCSATT